MIKAIRDYIDNHMHNILSIMMFVCIGVILILEVVLCYKVKLLSELFFEYYMLVMI